MWDHIGMGLHFSNIVIGLVVFVSFGFTFITTCQCRMMAVAEVHFSVNESAYCQNNIVIIL